MSYQQHRIYVASSWRNPHQPAAVRELRRCGHEVYDFRNPHPTTPPRAGSRGVGNVFQWTDIDPAWEAWTPEAFRGALEHPRAIGGFESDFDAMGWADTVILLLPCGRSAHLELGWAVGAGKRTAVLLTAGEPELMYRMVDFLAVSWDELLAWAGGVARVNA